MKLNKIEKAILERFLNYEKLGRIDLDTIQAAKRSYTGVGFVTLLKKIDFLKIADETKSFKWGRLGARLNNKKIDIGFIIYIEKGYIEAIEGYTYDINWPSRITKIEFYEI